MQKQLGVCGEEHVEGKEALATHVDVGVSEQREHLRQLELINRQLLNVVERELERRHDRGTTVRFWGLESRR